MGLVRVILFIFLWLGMLPASSGAADYAALVMDARTGEVLHSRNADTRLHPASLTKMMTLYIAFAEIKAGRLSLNQRIRVSANAAAEPPSRLGLKKNQRIELKYLIRAAAIKSANDAATAIGEAISGSEADFARYMTQVAHEMGMSNTTFRNAHGLTHSRHLSTARDMAELGRRLFYDHPEYYNLFSRISSSARLATVYNTNRAFLRSYRGADGIKTGYTQAAGYNLVASAERGQERIIASLFGGRSTASRNAQMVRLLDMGFSRAPSTARVAALPALDFSVPGRANRVSSVRVASAERPPLRVPYLTSSAQMADAVSGLVSELQTGTTVNGGAKFVSAPGTLAMTRPTHRNGLNTNVTLIETASLPAPPPASLRPVLPQGDWSIQVGAYRQRGDAERILLRTALSEMESLEGAMRDIRPAEIEGVTMYRARFTSLTEDNAEKACQRLVVLGSPCEVVPPIGG